MQCIAKTLNISFYIVYSSDRGMSNQEKSLGSRPQLGPRQKEVLAYLQQNGGSMWSEELYNRFVHTVKYQRIFYGRLYGLERKGLIQIREEVNPKTGRQKKKVYLVK